MLYVITDTHLGHRAMCHSCGRPENFSEQICHNWQNMVNPADTVIHLGDIAWDEQWLHRLMRLPGRKILVRGNHDHQPSAYYQNIGFSKVVERLELEVHGEKLVFSHEPLHPAMGCWNLHGHYHDLHREQAGLYLPLSLEHMGYKPLALSESFVGHLRLWREQQHLPTLQEIMALGQGAIGEVRQRDLYGTMPYDESFTSMVFAGAEGETLIAREHVAYWQVRHGTFFLVLQDMKLEQQSGDLAYIDVNYRENRKASYFLDMRAEAKEQQGRFTMYWFPIPIDDKTG